MPVIGLDEAHCRWPPPAPHTLGVLGADKVGFSMPVYGYLSGHYWQEIPSGRDLRKWRTGIAQTTTTPKLILEMTQGFGRTTLHATFNPSDLTPGFDAFHGDLQPMLTSIWDLLARYVKVLLPCEPWYRAKVQELHLAKDFEVPDNTCGWLLSGARTTPPPAYGPRPSPACHGTATYLGHGAQQLQVCVYDKCQQTIVLQEGDEPNDYGALAASAPKGTYRVELRLRDRGKGSHKETGPNRWGLGRPADLIPEKVEVVARHIFHERTRLGWPVVGRDQVVPHLRSQGFSEKTEQVLAAMRACIAEDGGWFDPEKLEPVSRDALLQPISLLLPEGAPLRFLDWDRGIVTVLEGISPNNHVPLTLLVDRI